MAKDEGKEKPAVTTERATLRQLAALFLKLGVIAFGGPAAHVAMLEEEVVRRRRACRVAALRARVK